MQAREFYNKWIEHEESKDEDEAYDHTRKEFNLTETEAIILICQLIQ